MQIDIFGSAPKIKLNEIRFATRFIFSHIVSKKVYDRTTVTIKFITPNKKQKAEGLFGCTYNISDDTYVIELTKNFSRKRIIQTLAHELVHVKQYAMHQLGDSVEIDGKTHRVWKKKTVLEEGLNYFFTPWEVEAAGKEYGLLRVYEAFIKTQKYTF